MNAIIKGRFPALDVVVMASKSLEQERKGKWWRDYDLGCHSRLSWDQNLAFLTLSWCAGKYTTSLVAHNLALEGALTIYRYETRKGFKILQ